MTAAKIVAPDTAAYPSLAHPPAMRLGIEADSLNTYQMRDKTGVNIVTGILILSRTGK